MQKENDHQHDKGKTPFSPEENLRARSYYENYYEELAAHATEMEKKGQHELAQDSRDEMDRVSVNLGDLTKEYQAYFDAQQLAQSQAFQRTQSPDQAARPEMILTNENNPSQSDQQEIEKPEQTNPAEIADIPQEELIPVDKSHFTQEALDAQARADKELAEEEAAMDKKIRSITAEIEEQEKGETRDYSERQSQEGSQEQLRSTTAETESQDVGTSSSSEDEDYYHGYGI